MMLLRKAAPRGAFLAISLALAATAPVFADGTAKLTDWAQPTADNIQTIISEMSLEEKARFVHGDGMSANPIGCAGSTHAIDRLGIPSIMLSDGPAGLRLGGAFAPDTPTKYATVWPNSGLIASTWNADILAEVGKGYARDSKAYGVDIVLGPGLNIKRDPLDGRNFEYYSEDPYLVGQLAKAFTEAMQADGIGVCLKHYAVNSQEDNRMGGDEYVTERAVREIYTPGFLPAAKSAWSAMASYNKVNGTQASESKLLQFDILRADGGFGGLIMSDWGAYHNPVAFKNGMDLNEPGGKPWTPNAPAYEDEVVAAVKSGAIAEADLDRAIDCILTVLVKTNTFKQVQAAIASGKETKLGFFTENFRAKTDLEADVQAKDNELARRAATEGIVLLKNDKNTLPLKAKAKIALAGSDAYKTDVANMRCGLVFEGAGSGQVNARESAIVTPIMGLTKAGYTLISKNADGAALVEGLDAAGAAAVAKGADVGIVLIGRPGSEGADLISIELTAPEKALIRDLSSAFHKAGKKLVVLLNTSSAVEVASWQDAADAIVWVGLTGQEAGNAIADVLSGAANPSGKLTETWPVKYSDVPDAGVKPRNTTVPALYGEDILVGYRYYDTKSVPVQYAFGYGLSYTSFAYSNLKLSKSSFDLDNADETITVSVDVTNTGKVAGKEIAQLYLSDNHSRVYRPAKELKGFAKTDMLQPGQKQSLSFTIGKRDLSYFDETNHAWRADSGWFSVAVGPSSDAKALAAKGVKADFRAASAKADYSANTDMSTLLLDLDAYNTVRDFYGLSAFDYPTGGWFGPAVPAPSLKQRAADLKLPEGTVDKLVAALKQL
jgi:Beta-glucosidase-related glycosidases